TEIPLLKQHLSDQLWALASEPARGERFDRLTGARKPIQPSPSQAGTIAHGFGTLVRYFAGTRGELGAIDDTLVERILGAGQLGEPVVFEDQYVSTGGQLHELLMGHDRWVADLRPLLEPVQQRRRLPLGHCCHPYDLCTELIARQSGVEITDEHGKRLRVPLDVNTNVSWVGYANRAIRAQVEPVLQRLLQERGLLPPKGADDVAH
ncbi:MAG: inositol monophosphatase, partial [Phycisphaerae bacterium]